MVNTDHGHSSSMLEEKLLTISTKAGVVKKVPFPGKLFNMLQQIDLHDTDLAQIVAWQPHGRCFLVRDAQKFEEIILPRFFKMKVYDSFRRQLNLWGFRRISQKTSDYGAYYHKRFLRSKMLLHRDVGRNPVKGPKESAYEQPDFHSMAAMPDSYSCSGATASTSKVSANEGAADGSNSTKTILEYASSAGRIVVSENSTLSRNSSRARPPSSHTHTHEQPDFYSMAAMPMADSSDRDGNEHIRSPRKPAKRSKKASSESSHRRSPQSHTYEQPDFHSMAALPPACCFVPVKAAANASGSIGDNATESSATRGALVNGVARSSSSGNHESLSLPSEITELDDASIDKKYLSKCLADMYSDMVPLPKNFPPPSNEEWAELMQVVGRIE